MEDITDTTEFFYLEWKCHEFDIPDYKKGCVWINGKKWYFKLKSDNPEEKCLMNDIQTCNYGSYIISFTPNKRPTDNRLFRQKNGNEIRLFSWFKDEIILFDYMENVSIDNKCFFEIITGENKQKPKFDIDIETTDINIFNNTKDILIDGIMTTLKKYDIVYDLNNLMLFTSHGIHKKSGHIILDKISHRNNEEAKYFYNEVVSLCGEYKQYIDNAVYGPRQAFRIIGTSKIGADRPKKHCLGFIHRNKSYIYKFDYNDYYDKLPNITEYDKLHRKRFKNIKILLGSLVSFANYSYIPINITSEVKIYTKIEDDDVNKALLHINKNDFQYVSQENGVIQLKRLKPSKCPTCNKKHMKENAFIFIKNKEVIFNCRRNKLNSVIGNIV